MIKLIKICIICILLLSVPIGILMGMLRSLPEVQDNHINYIEKYRRRVLDNVKDGIYNFGINTSDTFNPPIDSTQENIFEKSKGFSENEPKDTFLTNKTPVFAIPKASSKAEKNKGNNNAIFTAESIPSTTEVTKKSLSVWASIKNFLKAPFKSKKLDESDQILKQINQEEMEEKKVQKNSKIEKKTNREIKKSEQDLSNTTKTPKNVKKTETIQSTKKVNDNDVKLPSLEFLSKDILKLDH